MCEPRPVGRDGPSNRTVLRSAGPADLEVLLDVQEEGAVTALSHIFPQQEHPFPRDEIGRRWLAEMAEPDVRVQVILDSVGNVAGFAATRHDELLHFGTAVRTWGSGLARQAHDELIGLLAADGVRVARLRVFEDNRRARRFYEKLGWTATGKSSRTQFPPHPVLMDYERPVGTTGRLS